MMDWRRPVAAASDVMIPSRSGWTTLGLTTAAFSAQQIASQASGATPVPTAKGSGLAGNNLVAVGLLVLLVGAWYLDRRVL
jgi:hypothetical protein